jgi:hypothetical protein
VAAYCSNVADTTALLRRWPWLAVVAAVVVLTAAAVAARRPWDDGRCSERARLIRQFDAAIAARPVNVSGPTGQQLDDLALLAAYAEQHPECFAASDRANIINTDRIINGRPRDSSARTDQAVTTG